MLPEIVVGVEPLIGFLNPQQFLLLCPPGIEDLLTISLAVDEEVAAIIPLLTAKDPANSPPPPQQQSPIILIRSFW